MDPHAESLDSQWTNPRETGGENENNRKTSLKLKRKIIYVSNALIKMFYFLLGRARKLCKNTLICGGMK